MEQQTEKRCISRKAFSRRIDRSPSSVKRYERTVPGFPQAIRVDGFRPMYLLDEVEAWLARMAAERPTRKAA